MAARPDDKSSSHGGNHPFFTPKTTPHRGNKILRISANLRAESFDSVNVKLGRAGYAARITNSTPLLEPRFWQGVVGGPRGWGCSENLTQSKFREGWW